jgi:hypothetical protein
MILRRLPPFAALLPHLAAGIAVGWGVLGGLLWLDVGGLGTLVATARPRGPVLFMLMAGFAITWGSAATGAAIMALGRQDRPPGGHPAALPVPAPVRARPAR